MLYKACKVIKKKEKRKILDSSRKLCCFSLFNWFQKVQYQHIDEMRSCITSSSTNQITLRRVLIDYFLLFHYFNFIFRYKKLNSKCNVTNMLAATNLLCRPQIEPLSKFKTFLHELVHLALLQIPALPLEQQHLGHLPRKTYEARRHGHPPWATNKWKGSEDWPKTFKLIEKDGGMRKFM